MKINNALQLKQAIVLLGAEKELKKGALIEQFHATYNSLRPINLIKNAFTKITGLSEMKEDIIDTTLGLGAGVLSKKILVGKPTTLFKRMLGNVIEFTVANIVTKHADQIKRKGVELIKKAIK